MRHEFWLTWLAPILVGCGGGSNPVRAHAPEMPTEQARCKVAASHENPLVTEWSSPEKANLETRLGQGAIAVAYSGCEMHLLPACNVRGAYAWRRTTTSRDVVEVTSTDQLYAKLPLGAVRLEGELEKSGRLAVETTVAGQLELTEFEPASVAKNPQCRGATHVIGALSVGAFKMRSGGAIGARLGAGPAAGGVRSDESVLSASGDPDTCKLADSDAPHPDCHSPIQVFLRPLPSTLAAMGPPGQIKVRFLPPESERAWDVVVGDRVICRAPCERWTDPALPYAYKTKGGFMRNDPVDDIPDLREHVDEAPLEVRTRPRDGGKTALGIVATSVGGVAMITGLTLLGINCGKSTGGCVAGAITLPLGALMVGGGVWLIVSAHSRLEVGPIGPASQLGVGSDDPQ